MFGAGLVKVAPPRSMFRVVPPAKIRGPERQNLRQVVEATREFGSKRIQDEAEMSRAVRPDPGSSWSPDSETRVLGVLNLE